MGGHLNFKLKIDFCQCIRIFVLLCLICCFALGQFFAIEFIFSRRLEIEQRFEWQVAEGLQMARGTGRLQ